jgi:hypothetical protein
MRQRLTFSFSGYAPRGHAQFSATLVFFFGAHFLVKGTGGIAQIARSADLAVGALASGIAPQPRLGGATGTGDICRRAVSLL